MSEQKGSLRKRITLFILIGIAVILLSLGVTSHIIIKKSIDDLLDRKLALSRLIRNNIDNIVKDNINRLYDISISGAVDLKDRNFRPEKEAVKNAYRYSIFTDGIFLLDNGGNIILTYPERMTDLSLNVLSIEPIGRMLTSGKPVVSNIYTVEPSKKKILFVLVPLKDKNGQSVGVAGGQIDPTSPLLVKKLGLIETGANEFIDIVDSNGVVIASSQRSRIFTQCDRNSFFTTIINARKERVATCHVCHESAGNRQEKQSTVLAFVPLETAPWGISVQELKEEVFASADKLKKQLFILGIIFLGTAMILTIGINRSIVDPLKDLIRGAERIASGDLSKPILPKGSDEIGALSRSFEIMREKLAESIARIQDHAQELESRVELRTRQINESQRRAEVLLKKIISSQEDERKRIARDLHDTTLQELAAALMRIDVCRLSPGEISMDKIDTVRRLLVTAWDGVLSIIQNLRPTLLDDLGLIAAIKWLLDIHLGRNGINYYLNTGDVADRRFSPEIEITLFRIIQEALTNIARHSGAQNVIVLLKIKRGILHVDIEDDGEGFDMKSRFFKAEDGAFDKRGLGILGMKERVFLIGGKIELCSMPGFGTRVDISIPLVTEAGNA